MDFSKLNIGYWFSVVQLLILVAACGDDDSGTAFTPINPNSVRITTTLSGDSEIINYDPQSGISFSSVLDDGSTLQLEIPPNPFDESGLVALTGELISSVSNLPAGVASLISINFGPSGFEFYKPAILTVDLQEVPAGLRGYTYSNGQFRLTPIQVGSSGVIRMSISHFSDVGLIFGDTPFEEIANPVSPDDFKHNIAVNSEDQNGVDKWLQEWKEKFIDPKLASASTLETYLEVIVTLLEFAANKQMLGVSDVSAETERVIELINDAIDILEMECNPSECSIEVLNSVPFWVDAIQQVGSEIDLNNKVEEFCGGALLKTVHQLATPNSVDVSEGREVSVQLLLINDFLEVPIGARDAYEKLETGSNDPNIAEAKVDATDKMVIIEGKSAGNTTVFVFDPCSQARDSVVVQVIPTQVYSGTVILVCDTTIVGTFNTRNRTETWRLTVEAEATDTGQGLEIMEASLSGVVTRSSETCDNNSQICTTIEDEQVLNCTRFTNNSGTIEWSFCNNTELGNPSFVFRSDITENELFGTLDIISRFTLCSGAISIPME